MNSGDIFERRESEVRSYCRAFPATFKTARGDLIWDEADRRYIDFFSGAGALNYGHNPPALRTALLDYIASDGIAHSLDLRTTAKAVFLESFSSIILTPRELDYRVMFAGPTGTNAIEAAMKLARKVTKRTAIAAFTNGFHGMTAGALAATGNRFNRRGAGLPLSGVERYPFDGYFGPGLDTVAMIRKLVNDPSSGLEPPAAFLVETIQGEGGLHGASGEWLRGLATLAAEIGSLIIVDDVQAGCGRTGTFFSFEPFGFRPDLVCLSKSISGFGLPMSLVLFDHRHDVWEPGEHNGTFRGNNLAFVTGAAALKFWTDPAFADTVKERSGALRSGLEQISRDCGGRPMTVRGRGLMQGLVCESGDLASAISRKAFDLGLVIETCGSHGQVLKCLPPITISPEHLDEGLSKLDDAARAVSFEMSGAMRAAE
jgi:diaminobutyrate-2-oxoglutarate transaminase